MIDKDLAEKGGVEANNCIPLLCQFHLQQSLEPQINRIMTEEEKKRFWELFYTCQRCKSVETLEIAIDKLEDYCLEGSEEMRQWWHTYLEPNWMTGDWPEMWSDLYRNRRDGLWNTNNLSENMIRRLSHMFLG